MKMAATGGLAPIFREGTNIIEWTDPEISLYGRHPLTAPNLIEQD